MRKKIDRQAVRRLKAKIRLYEEFLGTMLSLDPDHVESYIRTGKRQDQDEPITMVKKGPRKIR